MDGHPTLFFKPVYKSFRFKTCEAMKGLETKKNTSSKDNNLFIPNPKVKDSEVVQNPPPDESWKAAMDHDLPELVAFLQDSGYQFVKDICIDSEVTSQNKCWEENCDLDHNIISGILSFDAESSSESFAETRDYSSVSSNSTESKAITEHDCKKDSGSDDLWIEDGEYFREIYDSSSDHSTKNTIAETLLLVRQDSTKLVMSDSVVLSSSEALDDSSRASKASLKSALENARRVECRSRDSSEDEMSDSLSLTGSSRSQQKRDHEEVFPQSDSSQDTESSQSRQHCRGESSSSVSGPLAICSGAIPSFGSISFRSNSSTTSSRSFTFPILSSEWIGSPVRMNEADRTQLPRHRRWGIRFLCCSF